MKRDAFREKHVNLRGGVGIVETCTYVFRRWLFFGRLSPKKRAITLVFYPKASVGRHQHTYDSEIYITFNRNIRFNKNKYWSPINICLKGNYHEAVNLGDNHANVYALKF